MGDFNMNATKRTAVIFGGNGFIGLNLTLRLLKENYKVISIDIDNSSDPEVIKLFDKEVSLYKDNGFYTRIKADVRDSVFLDYTMKKIPNLTRVYNLACPASPPKYQEDEMFTLETNFIGMFNILSACFRFCKKKPIIFQASTSEVYGDPNVSPQNESYFGNVNTFGPRSCYDEGKRVAETICYIFTKNIEEQYRNNIKIGRIFNTYGPWMSPEDGRVITNFISNAMEDKPLKVYSQEGKEPTRSFCYIDDLLDMIETLMTNTVFPTQPVNIGNTHEISIKELAQMVIAVTVSNSTIEYTERPQDDPQRRNPDLTLYNTMLGNKGRSETAIAQGIISTHNYLQKLKDQ